MWKNIGQFTEETDRNTHTQCGNERLVIHSHKFPNSLVDFTAGHRIAHAHRCCVLHVGWKAARRLAKRLCSTTRLCAPLNSMTHFSQLGLAGWQGALVHAALNNWDCKVNVRRIAKDRSTPPPPSTTTTTTTTHSHCQPACLLASVSWLHTSKSHTSPVLESVLVMLFWNI